MFSVYSTCMSVCVHLVDILIHRSRLWFLYHRLLDQSSLLSYLYIVLGYVLVCIMLLHLPVVYSPLSSITTSV